MAGAPGNNIDLIEIILGITILSELGLPVGNGLLPSLLGCILRLIITILGMTPNLMELSGSDGVPLKKAIRDVVRDMGKVARVITAQAQAPLTIEN